MNGAEQRRQATVAETLDTWMDNVSAAFDAFDARVFEEARKAQETRRDVNGLIARVAHKDALMALSALHEALRAEHVALSDRYVTLAADLFAFKHASLWQRVRWLVLGR